MYVCICRVVTDSEVRDCVTQGVSSMRGLREHLGMASQCGKRARCSLDLLRETRSRLEATSAAA